MVSNTAQKNRKLFVSDKQCTLCHLKLSAVPFVFSNDFAVTYMKCVSIDDVMQSICRP